MKVLRILITVTVLAGVLAVASCWYAGQRIESGFSAQLAHFQHPEVQAQLLDYQRGLFRSEARSQWQYRDRSFILQHHIQHGPLPLGTLARMHSQLQPDSDQNMHGLLEADSPLHIYSRVHLNGSHQHQFSSPARHGLIDTVAYDWGGLQAELQISRGRETIVGHLRIPRLQVGHNSEDKGLNLSGLQLQIDARHVAGRFWTGPLDLQLQELWIDHPIEPARVQEFSLHLETSTDGERLDIEHALQVAQLSFEGTQLHALHLDVMLGQLDARAFGSLLNSIKLSQDPAQFQLHLLRSLPELLSQQPYLDLQQLRLEHPQGRLQLNARLGYLGNGNLMQFRPAQDLHMHARLHASASLLQAMIAAQQYHELSRMAEMVGWDQDSEDFQSLLEQSIRAQQQQLLQRGWLREEGDDWLAEASFDEGQLRINGQPANALIGELLRFLLR
jgi:uncharacterized protein YdgA (DUF945 family)